MAYSVTQNTAFLTSASILQKVISFVYFTIIARLIGVANTGQYFFALAFTSIFTVVADFGLSPVLTRELAKRAVDKETAVNAVLTAKIIFGLVAYGLVTGAINLLGAHPDTRMLVYVSGLTMFFDSLQSVFFSVFRAHLNLRFESIAIVGAQFTTMVIGTSALLLGAPLVMLILAYTIPSAILVVVGAIMVRKRFGIRLQLAWDQALVGTWLVWSWPFAAAAILSRLYAYADTIFISKLLSPEHLGWWSVPYKITFAFQFLAVAIATSLYPVASAAAADTARLRRAFGEAWQYLFLISLPIVFGLIAVARPVIIQLYGVDYAPSVPVLQALLVSLFFGFLSFVTGAMLNATNRQQTQTSLMAAVLVINVVGNIILVPRLGLLGAAYAALTGNIILALGGYYFCNRFLRLPHQNILIQFIRTVVPAALMGYGAWWLSGRLPLPLVIILGALSYGLLLFATGALNRALIRAVYQRVTGVDTSQPVVPSLARAIPHDDMSLGN